MGDRGDHVLRSDGDVISLIAGSFELTGGTGTEEFLEGIDLGEEGFEDWLREMRAAPRVATVTREVASAEQRVRPKVAVLPFLEVPYAVHEGALGDAVAQELTRVLSRSQLIDVIAHLSSRVIDPRQLDTAALRQRFDVDYIATGRCAVIGRRAVLDVDFVETESGGLIGCERVEIDIDDFLAAAEARIHDLACSLVRAVMSVSVDLGVTRPLPNVSAHALLMSAVTLMHRMSVSNFDRALQQLDEVAQRAPRHAVPRTWRAQWHLLRIFQGWSDNPGQDRIRAADEVATALDLNPECAFSLAIDGNVKLVIDGDFDTAARSLDAALHINPSSPLASQLKCVLSSWTGNGAEAVALAERARSLSPLDPRRPFFDGMTAAAYLVDQ